MTLPWEELGYTDSNATPNQTPADAIGRPPVLERDSVARFQLGGAGKPISPLTMDEAVTRGVEFNEQSLDLARQLARFESPSPDSKQFGYVRLKEDAFIPRQLSSIELGHVDVALKQVDKLTFSERISLERMKRAAATPWQTVGRKAKFLAASAPNIFGLADALIPGLKEYRATEIATDPDSPAIAEAMGRIATVPAEMASFGYLLRGISAVSPYARALLSRFPFLNNAGTSLMKPAAIPLAEFTSKYPVLADVASHAFKEAAKVGVASGIIGGVAGAASGLPAGEVLKTAVGRAAWGAGIGAVFGTVVGWELGKVPRAGNNLLLELKKWEMRDPTADPVKLAQALDKFQRASGFVYPTNDARRFVGLSKTPSGQRWLRDNIRVAPKDAATMAVATTTPTQPQQPVNVPTPIIPTTAPKPESPAVSPAPTEQAASTALTVPKTTVRDTSKLDAMITAAGRRSIAENQGQEILDMASLNKRTVGQITDDFFNNVYPSMDAQAQKDLDVFLANSAGGLKPGGEIGVDASGKPIIAKSWLDIYPESIMSDSIDALEGTDRGVVSVMEYGNTNMPERPAQKGKAEALVDYPDDPALSAAELPQTLPEPTTGTRPVLTPKQQAIYEEIRAGKEPKPEPPKKPQAEESMLDVRKLTPEEAAKQDAVRAEAEAELARPALPEEPTDEIRQLRALRSRIWAKSKVLGIDGPATRKIIESVSGVNQLRQIDDPAVLQAILDSVKVAAPVEQEVSPEISAAREIVETAVDANDISKPELDKAVAKVMGEGTLLDANEAQLGEIANTVHSMGLIKSTINDIAERVRGGVTRPPQIDKPTGGMKPTQSSWLKRYWRSHFSLEYISARMIDRESPHIGESGDSEGGPMWTITKNLIDTSQNYKRQLLVAARTKLREIRDSHSDKDVRKTSYEFGGKPHLTHIELQSGKTIHLTPAEITSIKGIAGRAGGMERLTNPNGWKLEQVTSRRKQKYRIVPMPVLTVADVDAIIAAAPPISDEIGAVLRDHFSGPMFDKTNEIMTELTGRPAYPIEERDTYFPFRADSDWTKGNQLPTAMLSNAINQPTALSGEQFKQRDLGANTPLVVQDAYRVYEHYIKDQSLLVAVGLPMRDASEIINSAKVIKAIREVYGDEAVEAIQRRLQRFVGTRLDEGWAERTSKRILRNTVVSIVANLKIGFLQFTSNPFAGFYLDSDVVAKRLRPMSKADEETAKLVRKFSQELTSRAQGIGPETDMSLVEDYLPGIMFGDKPRGFYNTLFSRWVDAKTGLRLILMIKDQLAKTGIPATDEQIARIAEEYTRGTQGVAPPELRGYGGEQGAVSKNVTAFSSFQETLVMRYDQTIFDYTTNPSTKGGKKLLFRRLAAIFATTILGPSLIRWTARVLKRRKEGRWSWDSGEDLLYQELFAMAGDFIAGYGTGTVVSVAAMIANKKRYKLRPDPVADTLELAKDTAYELSVVVEDALEKTFNDTVKYNPETGEELWKEHTEKAFADSLKLMGRIFGNGIPALVYEHGKDAHDLLVPQNPEEGQIQ